MKNNFFFEINKQFSIDTHIKIDKFNSGIHLQLFPFPGAQTRSVFLFCFVFENLISLLKNTTASSMVSVKTGRFAWFAVHPQRRFISFNIALNLVLEIDFWQVACCACARFWRATVSQTVTTILFFFFGLAYCCCCYCFCFDSTTMVNDWSVKSTNSLCSNAADAEAIRIASL